MVMLLRIFPSYSQTDSSKNVPSFIIGLKSGYGFATPVKEVYENGIQSGVPFNVYAGIHMNKWAFKVEPVIFITGSGAFDPEESYMSQNIYRNFFQLSAACYPVSNKNLYCSIGAGLGAYTSYNKPKYTSAPASWPDTANFGNNGPGLSVAVGYEFRLGKKGARIPVEICYGNVLMPKLKYESYIVKDSAISTGILIFMTGISFDPGNKK
ncbi:MAG: hypothetical protein Fur0041_11420 [Bacteroidia bacterium]